MTKTLSREDFNDLMRFLRDAIAEVTQRDDPDDDAWLEEANTLIARIDPEGV